MHLFLQFLLVMEYSCFLFIEKKMLHACYLCHSDTILLIIEVVSYKILFCLLFFILDTLLSNRTHVTDTCLKMSSYAHTQIVK